MAASYHRNQHGNRAVLEGFFAAPDDAEAIVKASGATLLTFCRVASQLRGIAREQPAGLAAVLLAGLSPAWLEPVTPNDELFPAYRIT